MNAQVKPIDIAPPSAQDIAARIATEQEKLIVEGNRDTRLSTRRSQLLAAGNDLELTACETEIQECRAAQTRARERIELLKTQLAEANRTDESRRLDDIAADAQRARDRATALLKKYAKPAREIATLLSEVKACEAEIAAANYALAEAKRPTLDPADPKRFHIRGHLGLIIDIQSLHEVVDLPSETEGQDAYWNPHDVITEIVQATAFQAHQVRNVSDEVQDVVSASRRGEE